MLPLLPDRETHRDSERPERPERSLSHAASISSDQGRALIPMWDSSDPERAPPPLPLNPQSPTVSPRKGTSSAIQSAHATLAERARESSGNSTQHSLGKRSGDMSPEKSLVKSTHHRRMQSLHNGTVRDLSMLLEGAGQRPGSPAQTKTGDRPLRSSTPARASDTNGETGHMERDLFVVSPVPGPSLTPIVRPIVRRSHQSILGDNTPPQSATMLALQNTPAHPPRKSDPPAPSHAAATSQTQLPSESSKPLPNIDGLSNQILSLTSIATALQKDIAQLSRRSRDNATDLLSLKEATNARDEDIRRSLREVITNFHESPRHDSRDSAGLLLDNKPHQHNTPPAFAKGPKPYSLPRIPSLSSLAASIDRDSLSTPSLCAHDASGTVAILERILRDMGTKQGNELLLSRLTHLSERMSSLASADMVERLITLTQLASDEANKRNMVQDENRAAERSLGLGSDPYSPRAVDDATGVVTQRAEFLIRGQNGQRPVTPTPKGSEIVTEDVVKIIRSIKDSVSQSGGLTAEVKALVRELRGEVLGMGREIGRRLELANQDSQQGTIQEPPEAQLPQAVEEGLAQLSNQMGQLIETHQEHLAKSTPAPTNDVDYQEVYNAMRAALRDSKAPDSATHRFSDQDKEDVMSAVKRAWEEYKPEVGGLGHGMAPDEILDYLKEGLQDFVGADERLPGATREEVFQAVVEGLKHFSPPRLDSAASLSRDEILDAVRECLEEFEFPVAPSAINAELSRDDMVHAVREGLNEFEFKALTTQLSPPSNTAEVVDRLDEIKTSLHEAFRTVSEEAKQNMAANGRDTEQVLDATKDGLERLRADLEQYLHQILAKTTSPISPESLSAISRSLDDVREELADLLVKSTDDTRALMEERLGVIHETVNSSMVPASASPQTNHADIIDAVRNGVDALRSELHRPLAGTTEILDALHEGLADLRTSVDKVGNKPVDFTANDEILEALKSGLDGVRSDIDALREQGRESNAVASVADNAVVPADAHNALQHEDIKNLEVMITQLRIKLEAMSPDSEPTVSQSDTASKEDISRLEEALGHIAESVTGLNNEKSAPSTGTDPATREDVEAIETILRNTKAKLDDLTDGDEAIRKEHIDSLHSLLSDTSGVVGSLGDRLDGLPQKDQLTSIEESLAKMVSGLDELKERALEEISNPDRVTKVNFEAVEGLCRDIKATIDDNHTANLGTLASAEDAQIISATVEELKERLDGFNDTNSKSFEERQAEIVGVGERVSDVKDAIDELHNTAKLKFDEGAAGIEALEKLIDGMIKDVNHTPAIVEDLKVLSDTMKAEFEESRAAVVGAKLDADEKLQQFSESFDAKIDDKMAELLSKYDEFQETADERAKASEARELEANQALLGTKTVTDELKSLVDTLGIAVTDSLEKTEEASKTVFDKVEEFATRTEQSHVDNIAQHQQTQDQVKTTTGVLSELQNQVVEFQPKVLGAMSEVLLIVGQHFEHSKASTTEIENKLITTQRAEPPLLPPVERYDDTAMQEKLDKLVGHAAIAEKAFGQFDALDLLHQRYDDTAMQEKLDKLVGHAAIAEKAFGQFDALDLLHQKFTQAANDISAFLESQTKQIAEVGEDREKTLQETTIALERQSAQREIVEANMAVLRGEENELKQSIQGLKKEHEQMARHKSKLAADVSSLETALRLRREELQDMEARAEGLERRILEGVMDHSRVLLMSKAAKTQESMSRKRVRPQKSDIETPTSTPRSSVPIALSAKRNLAPPRENPQARRILSLSQINNNTVASGMKRSQSVRTPAARALRKRSWAGGAQRDEHGADKENVSSRGIDEESDIDVLETHTPHRALSTIEGSTFDDDHSDIETLRRSSHGTTVITEDLADESTVDDGGQDMEGEFHDVATASASLGSGLVLYGGSQAL
ncbi:hypothetical protein F5X68DRAFT_264357 [Plectosphaerella plurivora]|uniref:Uncharacterized protein n=1 Tax=Plectosphaerella plurivora TaxID=936078 RepID=A0A9P9A738_9PEZI|nr:hypothetical protein F5X68DRAFT_264357 [Plectosphaerella plurivora]